jgi:integrase/recombinase XerD
MSALAPALQAFFTDRLITQRDSSPRTIAAYRDTFRLLLGFAHEQTGKRPFELDIDDLDAALIGAFLTHLERDRGNTARTRNARLGAIHSFYRFAALEHPEHAHTIARVMAIPTKRHERSTICYLDRSEITALLGAPDRGTWLGRRDRALLALMIQTGVRVSELVGLHLRDVHLGTGRHIRVLGKGRKKRLTPHVLRHTAAMLWRAKDVDIATIALLLGHESVQTTRIYEHADLNLKEEAIARTAPLGIKPGRYRPSDALLAFLEDL